MYIGNDNEVRAWINDNILRFADMITYMRHNNINFSVELIAFSKRDP